MASPRYPTVSPQAIGGLRVTLEDVPARGDPDDPVIAYQPARKEARYRVEVQMDSGEVREVAGDLVPYLTQAQISGLMSFMADLRNKAEAEIL